MGIPTYKVRRAGADGQGESEVELVRLEDLCWVLNGPALCEAVTGKPWAQVDDNGVAFKQQHQFASYFVGQLTLHCAMCTGRSSSAIAWLEKSYSYTMLASICYNLHREFLR
jgi:hypothetical protein